MDITYKQGSSNLFVYGRCFFGNYLLKYIGGNILWEYIKNYAVDCAIKFTILPFEMPMAVSICNSGWAKLTGGILIGLAL